jgi:hypothetical protein
MVNQRSSQLALTARETTDEAARLLAELRAGRDAGTLSADHVKTMADSAAALILSHFDATGEPLRDSVTALCEITALADPELSHLGVEALFPNLVENLNDTFDPRLCSLYDRLFAQVISFYRRLPEAARFDAKLQELQVPDESALLARKQKLSTPPAFPASRGAVKKIIILSRVTVGADVAVTGVFLARLRRRFPAAELVLAGAAKLRELFGGDGGVRVREVEYGRRGGLPARFESWVGLTELVADELRGLRPGEYAIFDPDSRLTQLGLLPLLAPEREADSYFFFESRGYVSPGAEAVGELASRWLSEVFGSAETTYPAIFLLPELSAFGRQVADRLRGDRRRRLTALSFGVGGNARKRLSDSFEVELADYLSRNSALILDKGAGPDEIAQADRIIAALREAGRTVVELREPDLPTSLPDEIRSADVLAFEGGIGAFASLIAACDQYVGYDSAGQHIAAALGVRTLTVFVNSGSDTFARRWQPYGPGASEVFLAAPTEAASDACRSAALRFIREKFHNL